MNRFKRSDRVAELIHRTISKIVENEIREIPDGLLTVTGVELSNDLKNARVFYSWLGDNNTIPEIQRLLTKTTRYIRTRLGEEIFLRSLPSLKFYYDSSMVDGMRMDKLLEEIQRKSE